jgi:energy-coupling factor transporter ATP-binding protein EcfA2
VVPLRHSAILVLDEATAALDAPTEQAVLRSIADSRPDTALVIISHHLQALTWVDRIILLDSGIIAAQGTHTAAQAAAMGEKDLASLHLTLVHEGLGPQNYTIRELDDFLCMAHLEDDGDFDLTLESGESSDEFYVDYPCLRAAEEEHLLRKFTDPSFDNPEVRKLYEDAVERERTRLLVSGRDSGE